MFFSFTSLLLAVSGVIAVVFVCMSYTCTSVSISRRL